MTNAIARMISSIYISYIDSRIYATFSLIGTALYHTQGTDRKIKNLIFPIFIIKSLGNCLKNIKQIDVTALFIYRRYTNRF